jgi:sulfur carrier protein
MIYINDKAHAFEQTASLTELFHSLKMDIGKGVAVALNNKVIPRVDWPNCVVNANDKLILIKATQGG